MYKEQSMLSISEIKQELNNTACGGLEDFCRKYSSDSRSGVQKLVSSAHKLMDKHKKELERLYNITLYERKYRSMGLEYIGGIDEVGRGPYAGPVVTACVILPPDCLIEGINDSKKLSAKNAMSSLT